MSVYIKLEEDGRFLHEMKSPGSKETSKGTWKVEGDKLLAKPDDEAATYELTWKLLDENRLSLYDPDEKETTVLSRKGTEFKPPWSTLSAEAKKLVGTWMARSDSMELSIVLTADGSFKQALRTKEGTQVTEGVFNVERQEILIVVKGEAHVQRMPFKLDGDTLEIIEDGQVTAELVRQGT